MRLTAPPLAALRMATTTQPASQGQGSGRRSPRRPLIVPFRTVDQAWLWTMAALIARREASPRGVDGSGPPRPATPDEVVRCLNNLYREGRIDLLHVRIIRIWGERGRAPNPHRHGESSEAAIWRDAMQRLEWPLRVKGFLAPDPRREPPGREPPVTDRADDPAR